MCLTLTHTPSYKCALVLPHAQDHPAIVCSSALKEEKSGKSLTDEIYKVTTSAAGARRRMHSWQRLDGLLRAL